MPTPQSNLRFLVESIKTKKIYIQGAIKELKLKGKTNIEPKDIGMPFAAWKGI